MIIKKCKRYEVSEVVALSNAILDWLSSNQKSDYYGGLDEEEVEAAMEEPSIVFISRDEVGKLQGFILLQKPTEEEEKVYKAKIPTLRMGESLIVNGIGVAPILHGKGIGNALYEKAAEYAKENGYTQLIGTIHPNNDAILNTVYHLSKVVIKDLPFVYKMKDGQEVFQQHFVQELFLIN